MSGLLESASLMLIVVFSAGALFGGTLVAAFLCTLQHGKDAALRAEVQRLQLKIRALIQTWGVQHD